MIITKAPVMNYNQYRKTRKLLTECCNYGKNHCLLLNTVCPQSISMTLLCNWFKDAVLPLDKELETILLHKQKAKQCAICCKAFLPGSNIAKYCEQCSVLERKGKERTRQQRHYQNSTHLEKLKAL